MQHTHGGSGGSGGSGGYIQDTHGGGDDGGGGDDCGGGGGGELFSPGEHSLYSLLSVIVRVSLLAWCCTCSPAWPGYE